MAGEPRVETDNKSELIELIECREAQAEDDEPKEENGAKEVKSEPPTPSKEEETPKTVEEADKVLTVEVKNELALKQDDDDHEEDEDEEDFLGGALDLVTVDDASGDDDDADDDGDVEMKDVQPDPTSCSICHVFCTSPESYQKHIASEDHKKNVEEHEKGKKPKTDDKKPKETAKKKQFKARREDRDKGKLLEKPVTCEICDSTFEYDKMYDRHMKSKWHLLNVEFDEKKDNVDKIPVNKDFEDKPGMFVGLEYVECIQYPEKEDYFEYDCTLCERTRYLRSTILVHIKSARHVISYVEKHSTAQWQNIARRKRDRNPNLRLGDEARKVAIHFEKRIPSNRYKKIFKLRIAKGLPPKMPTAEERRMKASRNARDAVMRRMKRDGKRPHGDDRDYPGSFKRSRSMERRDRQLDRSGPRGRFAGRDQRAGRFNQMGQRSGRGQDINIRSLLDDIVEPWGPNQMMGPSQGMGWNQSQGGMGMNDMGMMMNPNMMNQMNQFNPGNMGGMGNMGGNMMGMGSGYGGFGPGGGGGGSGGGMMGGMGPGMGMSQGMGQSSRQDDRGFRRDDNNRGRRFSRGDRSPPGRYDDRRPRGRQWSGERGRSPDDRNSRYQRRRSPSYDSLDNYNQGRGRQDDRRDNRRNYGQDRGGSAQRRDTRQRSPDFRPKSDNVSGLMNKLAGLSDQQAAMLIKMADTVMGQKKQQPQLPQQQQQQQQTTDQSGYQEGPKIQHYETSSRSSDFGYFRNNNNQQTSQGNMGNQSSMMQQQPSSSGFSMLSGSGNYGNWQN